MKRSIKTKLLWTLTSLISAALIIGGGILIWQNVQQMRREIFLDALNFAELTNDKIVTAFEQFYITENFLQFKKEVNPLLIKTGDIARLEIIGKSGELFYDSDTEGEVAYLGLPRKQEYSLDRARDIKPSLELRSGEIVYAKKTIDNEWIAVTQDEHIKDFPTGEVKNILFPHKNARLTISYSLSYDQLVARITEMVMSILAILGVSILMVSGFAIYLAGRFVNPIQELEKVVVQVGQGAFGAQAKVVSNDEIGVLANTFNAMSKTLKKNTEELLEKEKITKELDIAREIQQNMLPEKAPELEKLDISGSLKPATTIGGDIYDYLSLAEKGTYIFIADVTGHGVPAGMIANITHSTLYSFSTVYTKTDEIMKAMNAVIHAKTKRNMFATALLVRWDEATQSISYCNAGHEQIIFYSAESKKVELIGKGGMALGMIPNVEKILKENRLSLKRNDVLILYTDGIPEVWKSEKENLGMDGFQKIVDQIMKKGGDAKSIRESILNEVKNFQKGYPQQDDITIVVLKVR